MADLYHTQGYQIAILTLMRSHSHPNLHYFTQLNTRRLPIIKYTVIPEFPSPLFSPQKPSSNVPKLETIVEEGSNKFDLVHNHKLMYLLPVVLSIVSYILIDKYIIA